MYTVRIKDGNGCSAISAANTVTVKPLPAKPLVSQTGRDLVSSSNQGNQWFKSGVLIPGATSSTYRPVVSGLFSVRVSINGCISEMSEEFNYVITAVSDPDRLSERIVVFPNPVTSYVYITQNNTQTVMVKIIDLMGRTVWMQQLNFGPNKILMEKLASGSYWLLFTDRYGKIFLKKTLIKR